MDPTPLQQALSQHLGPDRDHLVPVCNTAIQIGQEGAKTDNWSLFERKLEMPSGRFYTVEEVITIYHLNEFIQWGGGEHEWTI